MNEPVFNNCLSFLTLGLANLIQMANLFSNIISL